MEKLQALMKITREKMKHHGSAHDFSHVMRVYRLAERIGRREKADMSVLLPAVLLHDIAKPSKKSVAERKKSAGSSARIASGILRKLNCPKADEILYCIKVHSFSKGITPKTKEAKILQDCDRLDAIGGIGIARCFAVGENMKIPLYEEKDPFALHRKLNDDKYSLDHFYVKLLKLKDMMHTQEAKKIAEERHKFIEKYLQQLKKEINL